MNFYLIALIVALVILIICLVGIGILMQYQNAGIKFPLHPNTCPDLWKLSDDGQSCTPPNPITNVGTLNPPGSSIGINAMGGSTTCLKKKWAKTNGGINWDGVSNYNGC